MVMKNGYYVILKNENCGFICVSRQQVTAKSIVVILRTSFIMICSDPIKLDSERHQE